MSILGERFFKTQQRALLLSADADPVHGLQFLGEQRRAEEGLLAVHENHRGELRMLRQRGAGGHPCAGAVGIHPMRQTIPGSPQRQCAADPQLVFHPRPAAALCLPGAGHSKR